MLSLALPDPKHSTQVPETSRGGIDLPIAEAPMSKYYLSSLASLVLGAGVAFGQAPVDPGAIPAVPVSSAPAEVAGGCDGVQGDCGGTCGGILTAQAEAMLWFLANSRASFPIATTDVLGRIDTMVVGSLGDAEHDRRGPTGGGRFTIGYWCLEDNPWVPEGIRDYGGELRFFFVGERSANFATDQPAVLIRPFFDLNNRAESGFPIASPGLATGTIAAHSRFEVWGSEANVRKNVYFDSPGTTYSVDVMAGLRYLSTDAEFDIASLSVFNPVLPIGTPAAFAGNRIQIQDSFSTRNRFYGGQVGIAVKAWLVNTVSLTGTFRLALGTTSEDLTIAGSQLRTFADGTTVRSLGGLLALPSNIGKHHEDKFAQVPEGDLKLAWPITSRVTFSTGISALYWSRILRPAQQVVRDLDITQIPNLPAAATATPTGLGSPGVPFKQSDLWILGLSLGAEVNW